MKNKAAIVLVIIFSIIYSSSIFAQFSTKINNNPTFNLTFHYSDKSKIGKIEGWTYPSGNMWETATDYSAKRVNDTTFSWTLPSLRTILPFSIRNISSKKTVKKVAGKYTLYEYFAESNDDVKIDVYDHPFFLGFDSVVFSGRGSEKYIFVENFSKFMLLKSQELVKFVNNADKINTSTDLISFLESYFNTIKSIKLEKNKFISNVSENIDTISKNTIVDHYGHIGIGSSWQRIIRDLHKKFNSDSVLYDVLRKEFYKYNNEFIYSSDRESIMAPAHFKNLLIALQVEFQINNPNFTSEIVSYYNAIKNYSASSEIRDRILSNFFMAPPPEISPYNPKVIDSLIVDASKYFVSKEGKKVGAYKTVFKVGSKVPDVDFLNREGKVINTKDLRGKVFLLESWGLGCGGCATFHKRFEEELWPKLKYNKEFIVLSVNDAKTRAGWDKGIATKLYTSEHYLNVSTMPLDIKTHPLFKHYKVNYFPFMLLVDKKGNLISLVQPSMSSSNLLKLIDIATSQKESK